VNRECGDMSGVIGPLTDGADVSDAGPDRRQHVTDVDVALPHAVYISVQMLETREKPATLCHFLARKS
jgi:hypothetical protein